MTSISSENPAMALVVDRATRKVIDCERVDYPYFSSIFERHDLTKVDIIIRAAQNTEPTLVPDEQPEADSAPKQGEDDEDNIPY